MSGRASWRGMDAYRAALIGYPVEVANGAAPIVAMHARAAYDAIYAGYPVVTGRLRNGLHVAETTPGPLHPRWVLDNPVVYARIFEAGGATLAGAKPQGRVFVPIALRESRAMRRDLVRFVFESVPGAPAR